MFILFSTNLCLADQGRLIQFNEVEPIFEKRCVGCHANSPTGFENWSDYKTVYEMREQIYLKVVLLKSMPMYTKMPQAERDLIKLWIEEGAHP